MRIRRFSMRALLLALPVLTCMSGPVVAQANDTTASTTMKKVSRQGAWRPTADGTQVPLWPDTVALAKPDTGDHSEDTGNGSALVGGRKWVWASSVTRPTMTIYRPKRQSSHAAIMVLPGGGYAVLAMDLEGTEICDWVIKQGMTCIVLKYRAPQAWRDENHVERAPRVQLPLQDAQRAMGLLRHRASSYGIDPHKIGVIGFSAGGHLAAAISNAENRSYEPTDEADREPSRPDFAILLYPGHLWDETGAKTSLRLSPWVEVRADAPPTLIMQAMNDPTDNVRHAMAYGLALNDAGVPVEMHLYAKGGHAFGMRPASAPITTEWPKLAAKWLNTIGILADRPNGK